MTAPVLVDVRGLGKSYPLVFRRRDRMRAMLELLLGRRAPNAVPVLRDVNLTVRRGHSLGLIGENGAGKSTLLKLITGVLTPTAGTVAVDGSVGALLELGAGFHPEYSGRENIAMSAALYGLDRAQIDARIDDIVAFADIGRYIDEPVKHYSSGMVVRLGFAIIAVNRPDLLITDEVLAVGDESFQKRCVRWIEDYLAQGGTLILVSHSMYHVQKLCQHACWLRDGVVEAYGDVFDVTQDYLAYHERKSAAASAAPRDEATVRQLEFHVVSVTVNDHGGDSTVIVGHGDDLRVETIIASRDDRVPVIHFGIARSDGTPVYGVGTDMDGVQPQRLERGRYRIVLRLVQVALLPSSYTVRVHPMDSEGLRVFDTIERTVVVRGASREFGLVRLDHAWEHAAPCVDRIEAKDPP